MKYTNYTTVKDLLADKSRWTQKFYSRDENGKNGKFSLNKPVCWCVEGAILEVYGPYSGGTSHPIYTFNEFLQKKGYTSAIDVNDILGYEILYPLILEAGI